MEAKTKDLWVFIETEENGSAKNVGLELLSPGRRLVDKRGGKLVAVVLGYGVDSAVKEASQCGADIVIAVDSEVLREYSTEAYTEALTNLILEYGPETLLVGATADGRDFTPRLACRLGTGLTANATILELNDSGNVEWIMPAFGGNLMASIICPVARPQIGTIHPGVFKKPEATEGKAEVITKEFDFDRKNIRTETLEVIKAAAETIDLEGAETIVAIGRGIGNPEGVRLAQELADVLGATMGATRAAVDAGLIGVQHQIGHSGKTVAPKLYIACGISGAIQHVAGMSESGCIIAINTDPEAAIFDVADYGVVGDVAEVLPVLIEEIRKVKAL